MNNVQCSLTSTHHGFECCPVPKFSAEMDSFHRFLELPKSLLTIGWYSWT